jgi:hypothetical protein
MAIDRDMTMDDELPGLLTGGGKSLALHQGL